MSNKQKCPYESNYDLADINRCVPNNHNGNTSILCIDIESQQNADFTSPLTFNCLYSLPRIAGRLPLELMEKRRYRRATVAILRKVD